MLSTDQLRIRAIVLDYAQHLADGNVLTHPLVAILRTIEEANDPLTLLTSIRALAAAFRAVRGVPSQLLTNEIIELRGTMSMLDLTHAKDEEGLASMEARAESGEVIRIV